MFLLIINCNIEENSIIEKIKNCEIDKTDKRDQINDNFIKEKTKKSEYFKNLKVIAKIKINIKISDLKKNNQLEEKKKTNSNLDKNSLTLFLKNVQNKFAYEFDFPLFEIEKTTGSIKFNISKLLTIQISNKNKITIFPMQFAVLDTMNYKDEIDKFANQNPNKMACGILYKDFLNLNLNLFISEDNINLIIDQELNLIIFSIYAALFFNYEFNNKFSCIFNFILNKNLLISFGLLEPENKIFINLCCSFLSFIKFNFFKEIQKIINVLFILQYISENINNKETKVLSRKIFIIGFAFSIGIILIKIILKNNELILIITIDFRSEINRALFVKTKESIEKILL